VPIGSFAHGDSGAAIRTKLNLALAAIDGGAYQATQYDVVGDGATDNVTTLQAALDAAEAAATGFVYLPPGTYMVSGPIYIPNKVALIGAGKRRSIIKATTGFPVSTAVVTLGRVADELAFDTWLEHLHVHANDVVGSICVASTKAQEGSGLRDVLLTSFKDTGYSLTTCGNVYNQNIEVYPLNTCNYGVYWDNVVNGTLTKMTVYGEGIGLMDAGMLVTNSNVTMSAMHFEGGDDGLLVYGNDVSGTLHGIDSSSGSTNLTTLVRLTSAVRISLFGLTKNSATNILKVDYSAITRTDPYITNASAFGAIHSYEPQFTISPPASGGTWHNTHPRTVQVLIGDGTLTDTAVAYDGGTWASAGAARAVVVPPGAYLRLTYSVVPTSMYGIVI
jgi:hypothetical protein